MGNKVLMDGNCFASGVLGVLLYGTSCLDVITLQHLCHANLLQICRKLQSGLGNTKHIKNGQESLDARDPCAQASRHLAVAARQIKYAK
eukprot:1622324-Amphidinium_carterae.1